MSRFRTAGAPRRNTLALCLALAATAPSLAQAQSVATPDGDTPKTTELDKVMVTQRTEGYQVYGTNTATKLPLTLRETPQSLTVFTRQRIEDFNLITIAEVLQQTPGVTVQSYDSNRTLFNARGFAINNFMFDGVPTNYTTGAGGNSILSDTSIYERIEIVRGASGLVTGSGNPSATVNMVRKRPTDTFQASTSLSAGSWDYRRGEVDVSGPLTANGRVRGRFVGAYTDKESWVRFQHDKSPSLYGVIEADLTDSTRLRAGIDYLKTESDGGAWSASPLFFRDGSTAKMPRSYSAAARWNEWNRESTNYFLTLEQQFGAGWSGRLAYNRRNTDTDSLLLAGSNTGNWADPVTGLGLRIADTYSVSETREDAFDLYASGPFQLFGRQHELVVGVNHYDRNLDTIRAGISSRPYNVAAFPSIYSWDGNIGKPTTFNYGIPSNTTATTETGYYAAVRLNPIDPLKVIAGVRYSDYKSSTDNFDVNGVFTGRSARTTAHEPTPYLGAIYDLSANISAFASYSDVFQATALRDINNQLLDPVTGSNYEYGFKGEFFGGRLYGSLNGFYMKQDNVATRDPAGADIVLPDGSVPYIASKGIETNGAEFELSGSITDTWSMTGGYTYAYSTNPDGSRFASTSPMQLARFNTTWRHGRWMVGGGFSVQSEIYQMQPIPTGRYTAAGAPITATGKMRQGGYVLFDLMGRYRVTDNVSVGVTVTNLFDKVYYRNVGFFNSGYWGEPRRVLFNLRASF
ncbi:TonB-dependent siderophore receptor [Stenotrophomonas rhizophila]|uniref:TonB-dependent siderophore receptor n=1 Tax=Stenotrophomonas rhizophila TaxID=216778 RepID=UPI00081CAEB8|nr:TonB-dependent siderophore receptor [Stenotrophomonas rhizophila]AOA71750.1 ligand-gated channel [Stenotrophomonas rhizophila]